MLTEEGKRVVALWGELKTSYDPVTHEVFRALRREGGVVRPHRLIDACYTVGASGDDFMFSDLAELDYDDEVFRLTESATQTLDRWAIMVQGPDTSWDSPYQPTEEEDERFPQTWTGTTGPS